MRLTYHRAGVVCKFILMTVLKDALPGLKTKKGARSNQARPQLDAAAPSASDKAGVPVVQNSRSAAEASRTDTTVQQKTPVRPQRQSQFQIRPPPLPPASTLRSESLFVTQDNDDQMWEPVNPEEEEDGEDIARLEWDPNHVGYMNRFQEPTYVLTLSPRTHPQEGSSTILLQAPSPQTRNRRTWPKCLSPDWNPPRDYLRSASLASFRRSCDRKVPCVGAPVEMDSVYVLSEDCLGAKASCFLLLAWHTTRPRRVPT
jgi:hypothetical protein